MQDKFDIMNIICKARRSAFVDVQDKLISEHLRLKQVNPEMAKGLHLAIMIIRGMEKETKE